jgi:hypothetical protein
VDERQWWRSRNGRRGSSFRAPEEPHLRRPGGSSSAPRVVIFFDADAGCSCSSLLLRRRRQRSSRRRARGSMRRRLPLPRLRPLSPSAGEAASVVASLLSPGSVAVGMARGEAVGAWAPRHISFPVSPRLLRIWRNPEFTGFCRAHWRTSLQLSIRQKATTSVSRALSRMPVRVV